MVARSIHDAYDRRDYLIAHLKNILTHFAALSADSCFLLLWAIVQNILKYLLGYLHLENIDTLVLNLLETSFAVFTLIPIVIWITADIFLIMISASRTV